MSDEMVREYLQRDNATTASPLVNPFTRLSGGPALVLGLLIVAATVAVAVLGKVHYDGLMDVHVGPAGEHVRPPYPAWVYAAEPLVDWLVVALLFLLAGKYFGPKNQQAVDYFGMSAVGRLPFVLVGLIWMEPALGHLIAPLAQEVTGGRLPNLAALPGLPWIIAGGLLTMGVMVWGLFLNYFALRESSGMKTSKAIPVYIGVIIVGEIVSKFLIWLPLMLGMTLSDTANLIKYGTP